MENRTIKDTELDKVLEKVRLYALSPEGRSNITADLVTSDSEIIEKRYIKIDCFMNLLEGSEPLDTFPSISHLFEYVENTHADIKGEDIHKSGEFLSSYFRVLRFLKRDDEILEKDDELAKEILSSLDRDGEVFENHPRLRPLIKAREEIKAERQRFSLSYMSQNRGIIQNDNPLYKNERVVIPLRADQRRSDDCYISGQSSSGATIFAEPFKLVELNNQVVISEERIRAEKMRIKHELSEKVRFMIPVLKEMLEFIIDFDFHYTFALWAKREKARHPQNGDYVSLIEARHPLLGKRAVPISVKLDKKTKVLVLSGANAGGKTVTMKTIALFSLINQICGFIPASELSTLPYFDQVLTDIGDGQSIENDASTFSSHMANISYITRKSTPRSLVILDELGSGTDPEEGAALSISILRYMAKHSRLTITTSHYGQVKNFAYSESNMMNASMEFDEKSSLPTYRVLEGIPGDSHAIQAAIRAKMPKEITKEATEALLDGNETSAKIITSLLSKSRTLDRKITEAERQRRAAEQSANDAEMKLKELEEQKYRLEKDGHKELNEYLMQSRREMERLVMEIKTGALTKDKTKKVRTFLDKMEEKEKELSKSILEKEDVYEDYSSKEDRPFSVGDEVFCGAAKTRGKILEERGKNRFFVSLENGLRMDVKANMLRFATSEKKNTVAHFQSQERKALYVMDVRGMTLEEALEALDDQLESALLSSMTNFSIIHGYGDGILSKGIGDYLRRKREVDSIAFARPEDGGMGKTYVTLKSS